MRNILFLCLFFVATCLGCGGKGFNVSGKVTFPDGKPVPRGQVTLFSDTFTAGSGIGADGTYRINMPVPAGTYKVTVRATEDSPSDTKVAPEDVKPPKPLVDVKYNSPEKSGLTVDVKGATTFDITVEPPK
ncbi:MAG: carboxypeptidase-like regulatory domain-containing protein [Planctomycetaceae bacterium]|jgi:hypothetical protein|nr:carboxypeptidase-like regulatory domain-containing protein [Planctomycetaceae bacterium]